jgi:cytoskeletal protein RodZ
MSEHALGLALQRAREAKGLSLDGIAQRTKVAPHVLAAIDRGALTEIPGGLFARGYIRAYAREVGLDGERLIRDHVEVIDCEADLLKHLRVRRGGAGNRTVLVRLLLWLFAAVIACLAYLLPVTPA